MKLTTSFANTQPVRTSPSTPSSDSPPEAPAVVRDSVAESALDASLKGAVYQAERWGEAVANPLSGTGALLLGTGGLYAAVVGGPVVGSTIGLALGPLVAATSTQGVGEFLSSTMGVAGTAARVGLTLGSVVMAAGAADVGYRLGDVAGKVAGGVPGSVVGLGEGLVRPLKGQPSPSFSASEPKRLVDTSNLRGGSKLLAMGLGSTGLMVGGAGGAALGATLTGGHTLLQGLLAHNLTLASLSGAVGLGMAVGAGVGSLVGARGGAVVTSAALQAGQALHKAGAWTADQIGHSDPEKTSQMARGSVQKAGQALANALTLGKQISAPRMGVNLLDVSFGANSLMGNPSGGVILGGIHSLAALGTLAAVAENGDVKILRTAMGEALLAGGQFFGAAGNAGISLPMLAAGLFITNEAEIALNQG